MPHHKQNIDETAGSAVQPSITGSEPALDAEAALRDSEQKYRVLFDAFPLGITISDPTGEILESNARAVELLGIPKDEHEARRIDGEQWQIIRPDGTPMPAAEFASVRALKDNRLVENVEMGIVKPDADVTWINVTAAPLGLDNYGAIITYNDISKRKRAEKLLKKHISTIKAINEYSIELGYLPYDAIFHHAARKLKSIFNIRVAWISEYDEKTNDLVLKSSSLTYAENSRVMRNLGTKIEGFRTHVTKEQNEMMRANPVGKLSSLHEISFGAIPEIVGKSIQKTMGLDWFMPVVLINKDKITGTAVIAGNSNEEAPDREEIRAFAVITANALERRRAEEALRKSEEKNRRLFETMSQGIIYQSADGAIISSNPAAGRILGLTIDQLEGKTSLDPRWRMIKENGTEVHGADHPAMIALRTGKTVGPVVRGVFHPEKNTHIWLSITATPLFQPGEAKPFQAYATFEDITDRKRAEEQYQTLFHEMLDGFALHEIICNTSGEPVDYRFLAVNPSFERITGLDARDLLGRTVLEALPGTEQHWIRTYGRVALTGEPAFFENYAADLDKHFEVTAFQPAPNQFACIFSDITPRKRAEAEKKKLEEQLQQARKMESVGRLAGGVAHDFNNMLSVILGHGEIALEKINPDDPLHEDLMEIINAAQRSADLTRQLLTFARKQTIAPRVIDLNDTVEGMLKMLRRLIGEDIELLWKPTSNLRSVRVDPSQIDQLLANLCVNARDAIETAGKITIETGSAVLDEAYCAENAGFLPGEYVMLAVSDNGSGMDKETLNHLFEPFFTTKELGKGTGLGLATVYGLVKQNNGFINVYSEPGQGTTFKVYLPPHSPGTAPLSEKEADRAAEHGHETILLVEDEPVILNMVRTLLEGMGYTVIGAETPGQAIRLANEYTGQIDLLMTDVVMPEMNGRELARNLLTYHPGIKRLFMSGYTANVIAHHGVLDEGVHFIQKPFSRQELVNKVQEALEAAQEE
jgi:PAS domain S-box-containing protein